MAIKYLAGNRITGLSSDTKPTTAVTDSEFTETDTKKQYIWSGSAWVASALGGTIEGAEITANTIPLSKLTTGTANRTIGYNASGQPAELASTSGTAGDSAVMNYANKKNQSSIRYVVDRYEDLLLVKKIFSKISKRPILMQDILQLFDQEKSLFEINKNIDRDEGYKKSLKEDANGR